MHECTNAYIPARLQKGEKGRKVRVMGLEHSMVKKVEINKGEKLGSEACKGNGEGKGGEGCNGHGEDADARAAREEQEEEERKREETRKRAKSRGHSTPTEVGEFAARVGARRVVVNHFSAMWV